MALLKTKSTAITKKGQIPIPKNIIKRSSFKTGTKVAILIFKDYVELRPMKEVSDKISTAIASEYVLSKDWNNKEDKEAWKNL